MPRYKGIKKVAGLMHNRKRAAVIEIKAPTEMIDAYQLLSLSRVAKSWYHCKRELNCSITLLYKFFRATEKGPMRT